MTTSMTLTEEGVTTLARNWFEALDRHDPIDAVIPFLSANGLVMRFPEGTFRGLGDFRKWYDAVSNKFFDEKHELRWVRVSLEGEVAKVRLTVNWQAKTWQPPEPTSKWLGFDATQSWTIVAENGVARIRDYTVEDLAPMPGSASL